MRGGNSDLEKLNLLRTFHSGIICLLFHDKFFNLKFAGVLFVCQPHFQLLILKSSDLQKEQNNENLY